MALNVFGGNALHEAIQLDKLEKLLIRLNPGTFMGMKVGNDGLEYKKDPRVYDFMKFNTTNINLDQISIAVKFEICGPNGILHFHNNHL
ncbi:MAG: hypothetical protein KAS12_01885 [Candidatus Aenigmarchaeota archaeon]|nr:hypothetical protein [Candidatus Aenigmarchaeota archaeon]